MTEHSCNHCEYYHQSGMCNAAKSDATYIDTPLDINSCNDWVQVDNEAREQAYKDLQAKVVREKPPVVNDLPVRATDLQSFDDAELEQLRVFQIQEDYQRRQAEQLRNLQEQQTYRPNFRDRFRELREGFTRGQYEIPFNQVPDEVRTSAEANNLYHLMGSVNQQKDYIINVFNVVPTHVLINPTTYHGVRRQFLQSYDYRMMPIIDCPIRQEFGLEVVTSKALQQGKVTVVIPVEQIMR